MSKLIIDSQTGTVLNVEHCYVVETDGLDVADSAVLENGSDSELSDLARRLGKSIVKIGNDTGWGDNAYRFTVSYSPLSVKDEADALLEGGVYTTDDSEYEALVWARDKATTEELEDIGYSVMNDDSLWSGFRENLIYALNWVYSQKEDK